MIAVEGNNDATITVDHFGGLMVPRQLLALCFVVFVEVQSPTMRSIEGELLCGLHR